MSDAIKPEHVRRFKRYVAQLNKLMREVQEYAPEANYYLACDTLNLMLGPSHEDTPASGAIYGNVGADATLYCSGGGDW